MLKRICKYILATTIIGSASSSLASGMPGMDPAVYLQLKMATEKFEELNELASKGNAAEIEASAMNSSMLIEANINLQANNIERQSSTRADLHNKEVKRDSVVPPFYADMIANSVSVETGRGSRGHFAAYHHLFRLSESDPESGLGRTSPERGQFYKKLIERRTQQNRDELVSGVSPYLLMSSARSTLSLTEEEIEAMIGLINVITPIPQNQIGKSDGTDASKTERVMEARRELASSVARSSLLSVMDERAVQNGPASPLTRYNNVSRIYFSTSINSPGENNYSIDENGQIVSPNDDKSGSIADFAMTSDLASPALMWRSILLSRAFQAHMAVQNYKHSLNKELNLATSLALTLDE